MLQTPTPTAIVTGGTRGIGRAIAAAILSAGGRVMITGRDRAGVDGAVAELSTGLPASQPSSLPAARGRVAGFALDVRDRAACEALMAETASRFGGFNTLVNNAGIGRFVDVADMAPEDWDDLIGTNLSGPFYCSRAAIPYLRQAGGGWIINIASLAGRNSFAGGAAYCASKAGLIAFSESLMQEVRGDNIRVSVVMPGSVATEFSSPHGGAEGRDVSWKLTADDVAQVVADLLAYPARSLPSKVEIRPARTKPK
jgi:NAD(P)-dependent dehydrogenase (short-subunit alcohol dehydrogenase family)